MYLSYSGFKKFASCQFSYWLEYVAKMQVDAPDDRLGSIYGSVVGRLFELFYMKRMWKDPDPLGSMYALIEEVVTETIDRETTARKDWKTGAITQKAGVLMWKGPGEGQNPRGMYVSRDELEDDVRATIPRAFRIIRHYRLLGPVAEAEVKLDYEANGHKIGGRADFIMERTTPHKDLVILDGKGSQHRAKYVDPKQLLWYAMLYRQHYGRLPDRLGFLFWRYEPPETMDWLEFESSDVDEVFAKALGAADLIDRQTARLTAADTPERRRLPLARETFRPTANDENCRFCRYAVEEICPKGSEIRQKLDRKYTSKVY